MRGLRKRHLAGLCALTALLLLEGLDVRGASPEPVRIGVTASVFKEVPESVIAAMSIPFNQMMVAQTGLSGQLAKSGTYEQLAQQLIDGKSQLGIFPGIEFAWAKAKHPELKPLVLAINEQVRLRAFLIVRGDAKVDSFADLQGKKLALARNSRPHCHLFLERGCLQAGTTPETHFAQTAVESSPEEALDGVATGKVQAAVVDRVAWDYYQEVKPVRSARLKIAVKSEVFPAAVIAYHAGKLEPTMLRSFHDGMLAANRDALGKQLLIFWRLTSFVDVPADYEQTLKDIVKAYPPAEPTK